MKPTYESPLASRYASKTMLHLFSPDMRYETWRRLWVALARAEHTLGLPITQAQVDELAAHVSPIDLVATRYGCRIQGATEVALTKLDVLSYMKEIPVCTQYEVNGEKTDDFPFTAVIDEAKPVLTTVPGWGCDISGVRKYEDLPQAARDYVEYVEQAIGVHISYVSVGAGRDEIIYR